MYELGGMTVMHDPSGCNSTYNTHDEPRWFDMPSLIFISGLTEMDAVLGSDDKFIDDVCRAAAELKPRFITICGSPVPMMSGFDFPAVARVIEKRTRIPTMGLYTNGTHSYIRGAGNAMGEFARRFIKPPTHKIKRGINILGATPLDFSVNSTLRSVREKIEENGFSLVSCWAMGSSFDALTQASSAEANLVISSVGLECAKVMYEKFAIPYVAAFPTEPFDSDVFAALEDAIVTKKNSVPCVRKVNAEKVQCTIIGEAVISGSIARAIEKKYGLTARVLCPVEAEPELLSDGDRHAVYEDEIAACLGGGIIIADEMFRPIVPAEAKFVSLPHEACSGRLYRSKIADLVKLLSGQTGKIIGENL
jgi:hypothetical protein